MKDSLEGNFNNLRERSFQFGLGYWKIWCEKWFDFECILKENLEDFLMGLRSK